MVAALLPVLAFCVGFFLTRGLIGWAPALGLVQIPNARSSHSLPTPSGGGIAIAVAVLACAAAMALHTQQPISFYTLLGLSGSIAFLGFADDIYDLRAGSRFLVQVAVVSSTILIFWPLPEAFFFGVTIAGPLLGVFLIVAGLWWINLFNFMDGIDGLAASQALLYLVGLLALWIAQDGWSTLHDPVAGLALITAAATIGFLCHNWPPARIFMGDAGSNFLALVILFTALSLVADGLAGYGTIITLTSVFWADATTTLLRRLLQGNRPWSAHKSHAYQRLSRRFRHGKVAVAYAMLTAFWALPSAFATLLAPSLEWPIAIATLTLMSLLALRNGAGNAKD